MFQDDTEHFVLYCIDKFPGMPSGPYLYADDLIATLKKKHAMGTYKSMVTN